MATVKTHCDIPACDDMWRSAEVADIYGYTFWYANACNTYLGSDVTRMASNGKLWWRAEAVGDHDFQDRNDLKNTNEKQDEMHDPLNIRRDAMITLSSGSRGFINPRWRALQDGFLQGGYGWYALDGTRTDRSEMVKTIERWANGPVSRALWDTNPVRGDIGLLLLEEPMIFCHASFGSTRIYNYAYQGAYDAFTDSGFQVDPIRLKDLPDYDTIYVPYPFALGEKTVALLSAWVEQGGTLISEACFGYFNEYGHAFERQPSRGLEKMLGCTQADVHLGPDRWKQLTFQGATGEVRGNIYRQSYTPTTGKACGSYDNGECAVVENTFGKGKVRLIGSVVGYAYHTRPDEGTRRFFASHLHFAGKQPHVKLPFNTGIVPRIWADQDSCYLWLTNVTTADQHVIAEINFEQFGFQSVQVIRGGTASVSGHTVEIDCPQRDAVVVELV